MESSEWKKIDFNQFINDYNSILLLNHAPTIIHPKKDKEHEAYNALIAFFFIIGGLLIYIAVSLFIMDIYFSIFIFVAIIVIASTISIICFIYYLKSNVFIIPIECWVEIYSYLNYFCFSYYIVFSGKCHPNKAKNIIFKLYQQEFLKSSIDITQIEVYLKNDGKNSDKFEPIGFFFEYGEGNPFINENIDHNSWKFFPYNIFEKENYIAVANWAHQYEWRDNLELDFDKLHQYAPWIIKRWDNITLKPLTEDFKKKIRWNLREINAIPKLNPWNEKGEDEQYSVQNPHWENKIIDDAIKNVIGEEWRVEAIKDLDLDLFELKAYFRELSKN